MQSLASVERRAQFARQIKQIGLRADFGEHISSRHEKATAIASEARTYFSELMGKEYPMPLINAVENKIAGEHIDRPSTLRVGRSGDCSAVLHEFTHHLRLCEGVATKQYHQNPLSEEMICQFIPAAVLCGRQEHGAVVRKLYSITDGKESHVHKLDIMALRLLNHAIMSMERDHMDPGTSNGVKTLLARSFYELAKYKGVPRKICDRDRFFYMRYPFSRAMATLMYLNFSDVEDAMRVVISMGQADIMHLVASVSTASLSCIKVMEVDSYLRERFISAPDFKPDKFSNRLLRTYPGSSYRAL